MLRITICPSCGSDRINPVCRDWTGKFRGQSYTVPKLEFSNARIAVRKSMIGRPCGG